MARPTRILWTFLLLIGTCAAQQRATVSRSFSVYQVTQPSLAASPDGKTLYLQLLGDLLAVPTKGGPAVVLTTGPAYDSWPFPSPDGESLYFLSDRIDLEDQVHRLDLATGVVAPVGEQDSLFSLRDLRQAGQIPRDGSGGLAVPYRAADGRRIEWASVDSALRYVVSCESGPWDQQQPGALEIVVVELATKRVVYRCANGPYAGAADLETRAAFAGGKAYVPRGAVILEVDLTTGKAKVFDWLARVTHSLPMRGNRRRAGDSPANPAAEPLILEDFVVVDVETGELREHQRIYLDSGRIQSIEEAVGEPASDVRVIVGRGRFLLPGLFDMHVDETSASSPAMLAYGVTTVRQFGTDSLDSDHTIGPRIVSAPDLFAGKSSASARRRLATVIERSHGQGLPVTAKASTLRAIVTGITDGLDCLEHYPEDVSAMGDDLLALLKHGTVAFCPTLSVRGLGDFKMRFAAEEFEQEHFRRAVNPVSLLAWRERPMIDASSDDNLSALLEQRSTILARAVRLGVQVLVGSDCGLGDALIGPSTHWEIEALVMGGLSPREALYAATRAPAIYTGHRDRGSLHPGQVADLVVLRENPLAQIENTRSIDAVVQGGRWFAVGELLAGK